MKPQVYKDPRPPEAFAGYHKRARSRRPGWVYTATRVVLTPYLVFLHRLTCGHSERVPVNGPAILVPNHFSFVDHFIVAVFLRRRLQFVAKSQLFKFPASLWFTRVGAFPVRRGHRDEEVFRTAHAILGRGDLVVMYAEGGRSRSGRLGSARPGVGRLALESGVPVVPVAIVGSERAQNWHRLAFPRIYLDYGEPVRFDRIESPSREQAQLAADAIFAHVRRLHAQASECDRGRRWLGAEPLAWLRAHLPRL